jgi:predicted HicB family RNase H-like nuclease
MTDRMSGEGETFGSMFAGLFLNGSASPAAAAATEARLKAEVSHAKSPRQRERRPVRTTQINIRAEPAVKAMAEQLADKWKCSVADVVERAIIELAQK